MTEETPEVDTARIVQLWRSLAHRLGSSIATERIAQDFNIEPEQVKSLVSEFYVRLATPDIPKPSER